ncbi:RsfA family transcriptional regulator [Allobacillus sp. GCM10007491]|uniref:RsfA family transcriptional regulator n=1 Tax=Allobacillus saliphilus TaxID=2912308 RepID=A0A941CUJ3_9BACI|nr:RsfA family transcriptional regulator [Allobacillus saliphilus]MBR7553386.1 RsfA family transcriptional regulator [Allobacillus saliphilus]
MVKVRQDAWSHEDDLLLAETVLRHIREGSTQLVAFEEVGDKLNRTAAACGFRWNAEVRKNYEKAVDLAKRQRKERKKAMKQQATDRVTSISRTKEINTTKQPSTIDEIIHLLEQLKESTALNNEAEFEQMKEYNQQLTNENGEWKVKYEQLQKDYETLKEDYQTFVNIMDRARKMVVLDEDSSLSSPAFKMAKNGNLEQIAK